MFTQSDSKKVKVIKYRRRQSFSLCVHALDITHSIMHKSERIMQFFNHASTWLSRNNALSCHFVGTDVTLTASILTCGACNIAKQ